MIVWEPAVHHFSVSMICRLW